jgi:hypothetical protein
VVAGQGDRAALAGQGHDAFGIGPTADHVPKRPELGSAPGPPPHRRPPQAPRRAHGRR